MPKKNRPTPEQYDRAMLIASAWLVVAFDISHDNKSYHANTTMCSSEEEAQGVAQAFTGQGWDARIIEPSYKKDGGSLQMSDWGVIPTSH